MNSDSRDEDFTFQLPDAARSFGPDLAGDSWLDAIREAEEQPEIGRIGAFEIVEEVGRGSQGIVYKAIQPGTGRTIALKRMLAGNWSDQESRLRFRREIETAASLSHPAVVTVFAVDEAEADQPLLAMEWVDGKNIVDWAVGRDLDEILKTFIELCRGVRHAHQRGVIHRDLKPANILVDEQGCARVLDFGLAQEEGAAAVDHRRSSLFIGTPAYAAPEQVSKSADVADTLTDLYSLGIVLFETVTGRLPYPIDQGMARLFDAIQHDDPPRPSKLNPKVDPALDYIILKALAKERGQRYQSVDAFVDDLQRFRSGDPVTAHPPSFWYQLRKIASRHRLATGLSAVIVFLVAAMALGFALVAKNLSDKNEEILRSEQRARASEMESNQARARAEDQLDRAEGVLGYLLQDVLVFARPRRDIGGLTVDELLERAEEALPRRFAGRPLDEAAIRTRIGRVQIAMGRYKLGFENEVKALELLRSVLPAADDANVRQLLRVASAEQQLGRSRDSETRIREALKLMEGSKGELARSNLLNALAQLARCLLIQERYEEALDIYDRLESQAATDLGILVDLHEGRGTVAHLRGNLGEAEDHIRRALAAVENSNSEHDLVASKVLTSLGGVLRDAGRLPEAESAWRRALELSVRQLGSTHVDTLEIKSRLAIAERIAGRHAAALRTYEEVLKGYRRNLPENHPRLIGVLNGLANVLRMVGRFDESANRYREGLAIYAASQSEDSRTAANLHYGLANALGQGGNASAASESLDRCFSILKSTGQEGGSLWLNALVTRGSISLAAGRTKEAEKDFREALAGLGEELGAAHPATIFVVIRLHDCLVAQGRSGAGRPILEKTLDAVNENTPSPVLAQVVRRMSRCLAASPSEESRSDAMQGLLRHVTGDDAPLLPVRLELHEAIARMLVTEGKKDEALAYLDSAIAREGGVIGVTVASLSKLRQLRETLQD